MTKINLYEKCKEAAKKHKVFYHYTNLESLLSILSSNTFRLTMIGNVNDPEEERRFMDIKKNKVFLACFNHEMNESIPLWKIYAKDNYGIRIGFSDITFFEKQERYYYKSGEGKQRLPCSKWGIREAVLIDVEYDDDPSTHVDYMDSLDTGAKIPYQINLGFVKRKAWKFEVETRARVYIDVLKGTFSVMIENRSFEPRNPNIDYIFCELTVEELNQMTITFNPFMSEELKLEVKAAVREYLPDFNDENFYSSDLEDKIRL